VPQGNSRSISSSDLVQRSHTVGYRSFLPTCKE